MPFLLSFVQGDEAVSSSLWTRADLARAVYFSGYPNYPPELTRLTRRKLEDGAFQ